MRSLPFALVSLLALAAPAAASEGPIEARLSRAASLAQQDEIDAAADLYRRVLEEGHDTPDLRYALGTLELQRGRIGPAVLHLTAATRGDPLDEDAAYNLALALEARTDRLSDVGAVRSPWQSLGERTHPLAARAAFFLVALLVALSTAILPWTSREGRARRALSVLFRVSATALLVAGAVLSARLAVEQRVDAVVLVAEVEAKKGPRADAAAAFTAHEGLAGRVMEEQGGYARLRLDNGLEAWIETGALGFVGPR